jgi:lysyl-tRNA synthetase class 2
VAKVYGIEGSDPEKLDRLAKLTRADLGARTTEKEALFKLGKVESTGEQIAWAFETFCEPMLPRDRPSFVVDFPIEVSPLARKRDGEPRLADRFEAFAGGFEIANAFTELNDPRDQESRFRAQVEAGKRGNEEAMPYDRDFVRALEHGMPPTAGEGVGIDRLVMLFTDSPSIRDVILFPLLRPEAEGT